MNGTPRFCREAQAQLPALLTGDLCGWTERTVRAHTRRCPACAAELARQRALAVALDRLRERPPAPPPGLLDGLLDTAAHPGLRERAAVPARGAVSGARPGLSLTFLTVGALASTGSGWATLRAARWVTRTMRSRGH